MDNPEVADTEAPEQEAEKSAEATLISPATYTVRGKRFEKGKTVPVTLSMAAYLLTRPNFSVNVRGATTADLQQAVISSRSEKKKPEDPNQVLRDIITASDMLDENDSSNFLKDGRPDARALSRMVGYTVTAEERDEALGYDDEGTEAEGQAGDQATAPKKEAQGSRGKLRLAGSTGATAGEGVKL